MTRVTIHEEEVHSFSAEDIKTLHERLAPYVMGDKPLAFITTADTTPDRRVKGIQVREPGGEWAAL